jgi:hypothetical protein
VRLPNTPENRATALILSATADRVDWLRNPSGMGLTMSGTQMLFGLGGVPGSSDWVGIVRATGRAFFLEVKALGKVPDPARLALWIDTKHYCPPHTCKHERCRLVYQELFLRRGRASGAIAMFADRPGPVELALTLEGLSK